MMLAWAMGRVNEGASLVLPQDAGGALSADPEPDCSRRPPPGLAFGRAAGLLAILYVAVVVALLLAGWK